MIDFIKRTTTMQELKCYQKSLTNDIYLLIYLVMKQHGLTYQFELKSLSYGLFMPCFGLLEKDVRSRYEKDCVSILDYLDGFVPNIVDQYLPDFEELLSNAE